MPLTAEQLWSGFAKPAVQVERTADGCLVLRSPQPLGAHPGRIGDSLVHWAGVDPGRVFLTEMRGDVRVALDYGSAHAKVRGLAAALLDRGLGPERPLMILSDNSIAHALLSLAAMHAGVPVAPISPAYSMLSRDHAKLRAIGGLLTPGLVYADDAQRFAPAFAALADVCARTISDSDIHRLAATPAGVAVDEAFARTGPDSIAKILFTSGSTGLPKGVINTQRMLCSNQQAILQIWPFVVDEPPVLVDWLPWNHTFGGNYNFNLVLTRGGTLHIDHGKPMPGLIERSAANLREIASTIHFNVPRGFDMLLPFLESDAVLRERFFSRLRILFYAGAALPQNLWDRLTRLAEQTHHAQVAMLSAWGSTETAPLCTAVHFPIPRAGVIGLPVPGVEVKMVPDSGKLALRVRGPNITPGYWRSPEQTAQAFDADGFYQIGDAGRFEDPDDPARGIVFDGRTAEDFKLTTGVFVHVGALRVRAVAALAPVAQDIVIAGHEHDTVGFLVFANPAGCRQLCADLPDDTPLSALIADPRVIGAVRAGMSALAAEGGSSMRAERVLLMATPPSIDAGEITDKGYINQRATLQARADLVERLYDETDPAVIRLHDAD